MELRSRENLGKEQNWRIWRCRPFGGGDFTDFDQLGEHGDFTMNSGDVNQRRSTSWREPATHWGDLMGQLSNHQGQVTDLQDPTGICGISHSTDIYFGSLSEAAVWLAVWHTI